MINEKQIVSPSNIRGATRPEMPVAESVEVPLQGQLTLANLPFSMGNLYSYAPEFTWQDIDVVTIDYLTDAHRAAALLPAQVTTLPIPGMPGYSAVMQNWAYYRNSSFGSYHEFSLGIPCLFQGKMFVHIPFMYVDSDTALAGGREIGGWPKKMAEIRMDRAGDEYRCSLERGGERLASARMLIGDQLFSTPLPANEPVVLPYPYNLTLQLPPPTGKEQPSVLYPTSSLKLIPGPGGPSKPLVAQLLGVPWRMSGTFYSGSKASVEHHPSEKDPFYQLPVLKILDALYMEGDMRCTYKDMQMLADLLQE